MCSKQVQCRSFDAGSAAGRSTACSLSAHSADQHAQAKVSGGKEQISTSIWKLSGGSMKQAAGCCPLYLQKTINPHPPSRLGGPCLDRCQRIKKGARTGKESLKRYRRIPALLHFSHHGVHFSRGTPKAA